MSSSSAPIGIRLVRASPCHVGKRNYIYRFYVMVFTFVVYASFHMTRKAISVVQSEWRPNNNKTSNSSGWAPFNGNHGSFDLGLLDSVFLFAYAFAMFGSGHLGDRMNLTCLLTIGMLGTGILTVALGLPYFINLHDLSFFVIIQLIGGVFQSVGWPTVVAIMTKWFGKGNRGLIFGIWNSHTSVGNILGAVIPGAFVETRWGYSFVIPGLIMTGLGVLVFFFLPSDPSDVDATPPQHHLTADKNRHVNEEAEQLFRKSPSPGPVHIQRSSESEGPLQPTLSQELERNTKVQAIGFMSAVKIPGVIEFSLSLFFAKLVAYTFLYWLPTYVKLALKAKGVHVTDEQAADLSTFFDVGGIGGGILIGFLADRMKMNAVPCVIMQLLCIPELIFYNKYGGTSYAFCIGLSLLTGFLVNGPYCLITTAVSADLATHEVLRDNQEAKATVAAIIDGTGSIGAAFGPLLAGLISGEWGSWKDVFYLLMLSCGLAALFLLRLVVKELKAMRQRWKYGNPST